MLMNIRCRVGDRLVDLHGQTATVVEVNRANAIVTIRDAWHGVKKYTFDQASRLFKVAP
jgi:hypothetical protein